jgi:hypothetical protein
VYISTTEYDGGSGYDTLAIDDYSSNYEYYSSDPTNSNRWELVSKTFVRNRRLSSTDPNSAYPDSLAESAIPAYPRMVLFNVEQLRFVDKIISLVPEITLAVSPASVLENGATNLIYTFTRTAPTTNALTVNYSIAGTAGAGDYTGATPGTGKTITFAASSATATLTIDPTPDTVVEPDETVILTLTPGTGYSIGSPASATGTILNDDASSPATAAPTTGQGLLEVCPSSPGVRQSAPVWCAGLARISWPCRSRTQPLQRI